MSPLHRPLTTQGFTLIEVMVALAIVALALGAGIRASGALTQQAQRQQDQWLAELCAENEMTRMRLSPQWPAVGEAESSCMQGPHTLRVRVLVSGTPNPSFRRVEVRVDDAARADLPLLLSVSTVLGRY